LESKTEELKRSLTSTRFPRMTNSIVESKTEELKLVDMNPVSKLYILTSNESKNRRIEAHQATI
jgi:hypothetical protein